MRLEMGVQVPRQFWGLCFQKVMEIGHSNQQMLAHFHRYHEFSTSMTTARVYCGYNFSMVCANPMASRGRGIQPPKSSVASPLLLMLQGLNVTVGERE